ncbi:MAG: hypothetical protein NDF54_08955 [archaeon GB-1867-035]|nr:hypothetical protein [Candidatus Culexmicrobium profundum]
MYGLKRLTFTLKPSEDYEIFLVRQNEVEQYIRRIRGFIMIGKPPRMVIYGMLGVGKTHFLYHLGYKLKDLARCIYIEIPPLHRRSRFLDVHTVIMKKIGLQHIRNLYMKAIEVTEPELFGLNTYFKRFSNNKQINKSFDEFTKLRADLAELIKNNILSRERWKSLMRFIAGEKLNARDQRILDIASNRLSEDEAVNVINSIANLIRFFENKMLILLFDEVENLRPLVGDSLRMFTEALRGLVSEDSDVGTIFASTGRTLEQIPIISDETIVRRINKLNYIEFKEYSIKELRQFMFEIINYLRDEEADLSSIISQISMYTKEKIDEKTYPFTYEALEYIIREIEIRFKSGQIEVLRPKEIMEMMDISMAKTLLDNKTFIDTNVVKEALTL